MLRRSFLTALPVLGVAAAPAKAAPGSSGRLPLPEICSEAGAPSLSIVDRTGRNGSHVLSLKAEPAAVARFCCGAVPSRHR